MIDSSWQVEEPVPEDTVTTGSPTVLVTLHFLRAALRRRWRLWAAFAVLGMLLGLTYTVVVPAKSVGTATVFLAHDLTSDSAQAMTTDVTLLETRTLAAKVVDELDLSMSPDAFRQSVTPTPVGSNVLVMDVSAPNDRAALLRARALVRGFLEFRTAQLRSQSGALINGYGRRVASLQKQAHSLERQYNSLNRSGSGQAADLLSQRSQVTAQLNTFRQTIQDTSLKTNSIVSATHVLDTPSIKPQSEKRRAALAAASGMIAGTAAGMGLVLFTALTSQRLRRRDEVAAALGTPVRLSVSTLRPRWPWRRRVRHCVVDSKDVQVLAHGLESLAPIRKRTSQKARPTRLALATLDHEDVATAEVAKVVTVALAVRLYRRGLKVFLVDLSEAGHLDKALARALPYVDHHAAEDKPAVFRPQGIPVLARGPVGAPNSAPTDLGENSSLRPAWDKADVVLTVGEVDPAIGAEHLTSWSDAVVLLVASGRSSAERLRSTAELIRSAGLRLPFAMMVGADHTDESLGLPQALDATWVEGGRVS